MRDERNREARLWFEIPDISFLGSGMMIVLGLLAFIFEFLTVILKFPC